MECIEFRTQKDKISTLSSGHVCKLETQPHTQLQAVAWARVSNIIYNLDFWGGGNVIQTNLVTPICDRVLATLLHDHGNSVTASECGMIDFATVMIPNT